MASRLVQHMSAFREASFAPRRGGAFFRRGLAEVSRTPAGFGPVLFLSDNQMFFCCFVDLLDNVLDNQRKPWKRGADWRPSQDFLGPVFSKCSAACDEPLAMRFALHGLALKSACRTCKPRASS